jgi:hypothetical protein
MARGKTITSDALKALGVKRLAEVLADACESDASLRRKAQILLAAQEGAASWNRHSPSGSLRWRDHANSWIGARCRPWRPNWPSSARGSSPSLDPAIRARQWIRAPRALGDDDAGIAFVELGNKGADASAVHTGARCCVGGAFSRRFAGRGASEDRLDASGGCGRSRTLAAAGYSGARPLECRRFARYRSRLWARNVACHPIAD